MPNRIYSAKGANALFASALGYSLTAILIRYMSPMWGDKAQVAARWFMAFLIILIYIFITKKRLKIPKNKLFLLISLGIVFVGLVMLFTASIQKTTVANTLFLYFATCIIATFLFGTIFLKERVAKNKILSQFLALSGLALYGGALIGGTSGLGLAMLAGLFGGVANIILKLLKDVDALVVIFFQLGVGSVLAFLVTLFSKEEILREVSVSVSMLTMIFALLIIASSGLLVYGYKYFDVNVGAAIASSEIAFGVILAYLLFKEVPAANEIIGGTLIFAGSVIGSLGFEDKAKYKLHGVNS